jgi:hypothetical protein
MRTRRKWPWVIAVIAVLAGLGAWRADAAIRHRGHPGLKTFLNQWWHNYPASFAQDPAVLEITVDEEGMAVLEGVVDRARERGVIEQEGNAYVNGRFRAGADDFKGKLRIKGKMTDHVEGRKWSFRVIAKKDGGFMGMKRFSLQHPGTRNYLCDWFFHRLSRGEGMVALRYGFCRVTLNEEDLGIYAYEEHFGPELLENNGRLNGPLMRFDPGLFWQHRLNGIDHIRVNDAYGAYQAAALDAYGTDDIAADPQQKRYFEEALSLVDAFRRGERSASQVFHADRIARRLALIDLVGGHHSLDWSDVKFYYDLGSQLLEPVSYESFSAFPTVELAGAYSFTGAFHTADDLHAQLLSDPVVMTAYIHHLERVARKAYLDSAFAALEGPLDTASATMYREFPYKELDRSIYYANQKAIQRLLAAPRPLHAYIQEHRGDTLVLLAIPTDALPVQVDSLVLPDGRAFRPVGRTLVPSRPRGKVGEPVEIHFLTGTVSDSLLMDKVVLHAGLPGSAKRSKVPVQPFRLRLVQSMALPAHKEPTFRSFPFVEVDEAARTVRIQQGAWTVDRDLVIPAGYTVEAAAPLKLSLVNGAEIVSRSPLRWLGQDERPIIVTSPDSSSRGMHVIGASGLSRLDNVHFSDLMRYANVQERTADVSFNGSNVSLEHCRFSGTGATLLDIALGEAQLRSCAFNGGSDQLELHFVNAQISGTRFDGARDEAVSLEGGGLSMASCVILGPRGVALKASLKAHVELREVRIAGAGSGLQGSEGSVITMISGELEAAQAVKAGKREPRYGPVRIEMTDVNARNAEATSACGAGSTIVINGKPVGATKAAKGT